MWYRRNFEGTEVLNLALLTYMTWLSSSYRLSEKWHSIYICPEWKSMLCSQEIINGTEFSRVTYKNFRFQTLNMWNKALSEFMTILSFHGLFCDSVSVKCGTADEWWIEKDLEENGRDLMEAGTRYLFGGWEKPRKSSVKTAGVPAKIRALTLYQPVQWRLLLRRTNYVFGKWNRRSKGRNDSRTDIRRTGKEYGRKTEGDKTRKL
jgi:hypothetical protein